MVLATLLQEHRDFELCVRNQCFQKYENYQIKTEAENRLPLATRQARAAAGPQMFYIQIPSFLDTLSCPLSLLTSAIRVEITFKPMLNCIQYTGTNPVASILSANLRCRYINCDPEIMMNLLEVSKKQSVLFPFYDCAQSQTDFAPGVQSMRFLLTEMKSLVTHIGWTIRDVQEIDDTTGNSAFEISNTLSFNTWNLEDKGVFIVSNPDNLTPDYSKLVENVQIFESYVDPATRNTPEYYYIPHAFCIEPQRDLHISDILGTGYYDFSKTSSAYINIIGPDSTFASRFTIFGWFLNVLILRNGVLTKYVL